MIQSYGKRELCWDLHLAQYADGIRLEVHRPQRKNIAFTCDAPWEAFGVNYIGLLRVNGKYRLYYRARDAEFLTHYINRFCYAESDDGIVFTRPDLGLVPFGECTATNIHFQPSCPIDNFSVFYDENPACPADEKFKALSAFTNYLPGGGTKNDLHYYASADGITFRKIGTLPVPGVFDSYNIVFWDAPCGEYKLYLRDFHTADGEPFPRNPRESDLPYVYRDVRLSRSRDFATWTEPEMIRFSDGDLHTELYTGMIHRIPGTQFFLGLPTRYINRPDAGINYRHLPSWNGKRQEYLKTGSRLGSVFNDTGIMTSRDGVHFDKLNEAYMTTGPERDDNWYYEDCYLGYGMAQTESDYPGEPPELSLYRPEGWHTSCTRIVRYTVRRDGFFSWHADGNGGTLLTHPMTVTGDSMEINFATSSLGGVRIVLCGDGGEPIPGYDSGVLFGDSLTRPVEFEESLASLAGQRVCIRFELCDADLYSFRFL